MSYIGLIHKKKTQNFILIQRISNYFPWLFVLYFNFFLFNNLKVILF